MLRSVESAVPHGAVRMTLPPYLILDVLIIRDIGGICHLAVARGAAAQDKRAGRKFDGRLPFSELLHIYGIGT